MVVQQLDQLKLKIIINDISNVVNNNNNNNNNSNNNIYFKL